MINGPGYYLNDNGDLLYAATQITWSDLVLTVADGGPASPTVRGWKWFVDEPTARTYFGLPLTPQEA